MILIQIEDNKIGRLILDVATMTEDEANADVRRHTIEDGLWAIQTIISYLPRKPKTIEEMQGGGLSNEVFRIIEGVSSELATLREKIVSDKHSGLPSNSWVKLMGAAYWRSLDEEQLWAWIEVLGRSSSQHISLSEAFAHCGYEDMLLGDPESFLAEYAENYQPQTTRAEILEQEIWNMWMTTGEEIFCDDILLAVWCAQRVDRLRHQTLMRIKSC